MVRFFSPGDVVGTLEDPALLREVIEAGFDVNSSLDGGDGRRGTLLTEACHHKCHESVRVLLDTRRADVNQADEVRQRQARQLRRRRARQTPSRRRASNPQPRCVPLFDCFRGPRSQDGFAPIHIAAGRNDDDVLTLLLSEPSLNLEARVRAGATGAWCKDMGSCRRQDVPSDAEADDDGPSASGCRAEDAELGRTAMHLAAQYGCYRALRVLLSHPDCDLMLRAGRLRLTPLHVAVRHDQAACVAAILEDARCGEAVVNALDAKGETPLIRGVRRGSALSVHLLCKRADVRVGVRAQCMGLTALHMAAMSCNRCPCLRAMLRRADVDPSAASADGCTPLHAAVWSNSPDAVRTLLAHPATNANAGNELAWSPLTMGLRGLAQARARLEGEADKAWAAGQRQLGASRATVRSPADAAGGPRRDAGDEDDEDAVPWAGAMSAAVGEEDDAATVSSAGARSVGGQSDVSGRSGGAPGSVSSSSSSSSVATGQGKGRRHGPDHTGAGDDAAALVRAVVVLTSDLRVDLTRRERKPWRLFPKDAAAVARKYRLRDAERLVAHVMERRGTETLQKGHCDSQLAAWFTSRGVGAAAASAVMSCSMGVRELRDLRVLAEAAREAPDLLVELDMPVLDRSRLGKELRSVLEECEREGKSCPGVLPRAWEEEALQLDAEVSTALARANSDGAEEEAGEAGGEQVGGDGGGGSLAGGRGEEGKRDGPQGAEAGEEGGSTAAAGAGASAAAVAGGGARDDATGGAAGDAVPPAADGVPPPPAPPRPAPPAASPPSGLDLPFRSLLRDYGLPAEAEDRLAALDPPVTTRNRLAAIAPADQAAVADGLGPEVATQLAACVDEARQLPRHSSGVAARELADFLSAKGLDDAVWLPILARLGARRPSHLVSVRPEHVAAETIAPLQRDAFFRAVGTLPGAKQHEPLAAPDSGAGGGATALHHAGSASAAAPLVAEEAHPQSLIGFVNFWLVRLYRDRPVVATVLIVVVILAIVGGVVFGTLSATDVVGSGSSARLLRGSKPAC